MDTMAWHILIPCLALVLILQSNYGVNALHCHLCNGVSDPKFCVQAVACQAGEECYTEKVVGDYSNVFFNSGCKKVQMCQLSATSGVTVHHQRRDQIHVCEECCGSELCNANLCHANITAGIGDCYQCDDVADPQDCQNKIRCSPDQMCFTQEFIDIQFRRRFKLSCESRKRCQILQTFGRRRRSTQLCNQCCTNPGCNRHLCYGGSSG